MRTYIPQEHTFETENTAWVIVIFWWFVYIPD